MKVVKIIELELARCEDCPYLTFDCKCLHPNRYNDIVLDCKQIPQWCPLSDREEYQ